MPAEDVPSELLRNKEYSDLKIECGSSTFYVHKSIVFTHAPNIKEFFDAYDEKPGPQEVTMHDWQIDPEHLKTALDYIYLGKYSVDKKVREETVDFNIDMYHMSRTFDIQGLRTLAISNLEEALNGLRPAAALEDIKTLFRYRDVEMCGFLARWFIKNAPRLDKEKLDGMILVSLGSLHHYLESYIDEKVAEKLHSAETADEN